jgi:hypothetical protein
MIEKRIGIDGEEVDAFSRRSRRVIRWKRGQLTKIKRRANKRYRSQGKSAARREAW